MTKEQIDFAALVATIKSQPAQTQKRIVQTIDLVIEQDEQPRYQPTAEQKADLAEAIKEADAGKFLTDEQAVKFWREL